MWPCRPSRHSRSDRRRVPAAARPAADYPGARRRAAPSPSGNHRRPAMWGRRLSRTTGGRSGRGRIRPRPRAVVGRLAVSPRFAQDPHRVSRQAIDVSERGGDRQIVRGASSQKQPRDLDVGRPPSGPSLETGHRRTQSTSVRQSRDERFSVRSTAPGRSAEDPEERSHSRIPGRRHEWHGCRRLDRAGARRLRRSSDHRSVQRRASGPVAAVHERRIGVEKRADTADVAGFRRTVDRMIGARLGRRDTAAARARLLEEPGDFVMTAIPGHVDEGVAVESRPVRFAPASSRTRTASRWPSRTARSSSGRCDRPRGRAWDGVRAGGARRARCPPWPPRSRHGCRARGWSRVRSAWARLRWISIRRTGRLSRPVLLRCYVPQAFRACELFRERPLQTAVEATRRPN